MRLSRPFRAADMLRAAGRLQAVCCAGADETEAAGGRLLICPVEDCPNQKLRTRTWGRPMATRIVVGEAPRHCNRSTSPPLQPQHLGRAPGIDRAGKSLPTRQPVDLRRCKRLEQTHYAHARLG